MRFVVIAHGALSRDHKDNVTASIVNPHVAEDWPSVTDEMMEDVEAAHVVMEAELMKCPKTLHNYGRR